MFATGLKCTTCNKEFPISHVLYTCPSCSGLLEVDYAYAEIAEHLNRNILSSRALKSMWRYSELLPVDSYEDITLGEGFTALSRSKRLEEELKLGRTYFKLEFTCPSGSFKDRGASLLAARAKELGYSGTTIDSSGNAAISLATFCARAALQCLVFVPSYASTGKLTQCIAAGANVIKVNGTRQQTYEVANKAREKLRLYYCGFQTNCFSSEGMRTLGYEICEQFDWTPPDWIIFPVGTGSGLSGCFKGLMECRNLGWVNEIPRIACIQSDGCAPISTAFKTKMPIIPVQDPASIAEGLLISNPLRGTQVLSILKQTQGVAETVSDAEIEEAAKLLASREGLYVEPSAAVSLAGLTKLTSKGELRKDESVVCVLTGSGLKTSDFFKMTATEPLTVEPQADISKVIDAIRRSA